MYSILKLHQTQKTTPEYQTSTLDGDEFPADLQSMDKTPIQEPVNVWNVIGKPGSSNILKHDKE